MNDFGTFNYDGGDLGRGISISIAEFEIIVPHIVNIFQGLYEMGNLELPYKYGFEFNTLAVNLIKEKIEKIEKVKLTPNVSFYESDGIKLFQIRSASGGLTVSHICYLITIDDNGRD